MFDPGDVVLLDFPGVTSVKRRPTVILSSETYHKNRSDLIVGLITSQTGAATGPTDYAIKGWSAAGLRVPSTFRSFLATLPPAARPVKIGELLEQDWNAVRACVKMALTNL